MVTQGHRAAGRDENPILFPPFRLDPVDQQLWQGDRLVPLPPKAFAILSYLLDQPGQLIPREELLARFWGDLHLSEGVLKTQIGEIRQALGDAARLPRFIETVHRRGYRFIGPVERTAPAAEPAAPSHRQSAPVRLPHCADHFVGRRAELDSLMRCWAKASTGERQIVFVTGEAGVGKTALVNAFLHQLLCSDSDALVTWGQCIDQYGSGEPYLPVIEATRRACAGTEGERVANCIRQNAPTWLSALPSLHPPEATAASQAMAAPAPGRMLREMAETLEALGAEKTVVVFLEDLHWADYSTLDLVAYLAQRSDPARLLVLGTYRSRETLSPRLVDIIDTLRTRSRCVEVSVPLLGEQAVGDYLARRFAHNRLPPAVPALLHRRTEGNALFMIGVIGGWLDRGLLKTAAAGHWELCASLDELARCVPDSFVRMIEKELDRATALERSVLEGASVAGNEFSTTAVAAALGEDPVHIEELCLRWARRGQFLRSKGKMEWKDGTVGEHCEFIHVLYQQITHDRIGAARQAQLHLRIGERLEIGYAPDPDSIAAELALHFHRGGDYCRAVRYLRSASERAMRRSAYHEAIDHLTLALDLLERAPDPARQPGIELDLRLMLAAALRITKGYAAPEVEDAYARAAALCEGVGATSHLLLVMAGMTALYLFRGASARALATGGKLLSLAEKHGNPSAVAQARILIGIAYHHLGQHLAAQAHLEDGIAFNQANDQLASRSVLSPELMAAARGSLAYSWCLLGYPDRGRMEADKALQEAQTTDNSFASAHALHFSSVIHRMRGEADQSLQQADELAALCTAHGFGMFLSHAIILKGAAQTQRGEFECSIETIRRGLAGFEATGSRAFRGYWTSFLALAYQGLGQTALALQVMDEAMPQAEPDREQVWDAELFRIKGELLWKANKSTPVTSDPSMGDVSEQSASAEHCLLRALEIARAQAAKLLELRIAMSLSEYWRAHGKKAEGYALLSQVYAWFTEGLDTADLREARALLEELCP
jgi:DNA-binding winged helix-turn-helix (wHTH) protein/predicted ATPase